MRHCAGLFEACKVMGATVTSELLVGGSGRERAASTCVVPLKQVGDSNPRRVHSDSRNGRLGAAGGRLLGPSGMAGQILIFG